MRVLAYLGLSLAASPAIAGVAAFSNSNSTLIERELLNVTRCGTGEHVVTKKNDTGPTVNGCGVGALAGQIPPNLVFEECCNNHDRCYGKSFCLQYMRITGERIFFLYPLTPVHMQQSVKW